MQKLDFFDSLCINRKNLSSKNANYALFFPIFAVSLNSIG